MSWGFKPFEALTEAGTNLFAVIDPASPEGVRQRALRDDYNDASDLVLPEGVPAGIRDYFDGARMLWVYGWFYYPFYSMAAVHSYLCVELALDERVAREGIVLTRKQRTLEAKLAVAVERQWFSPDAFGTMRRRIERARFYATEEGITEPLPGLAPEALSADMVRLLSHLRHFRNAAAHPDGLTVWLPGMSYVQLEFVRDLLAQLFPVAS